MRELFGDLELSLTQATAIAKAMQHVAAADGVHQHEQELIDGFFAGCLEDAGEAPRALDDDPYDGAALAGALSSEGLVQAALKSCYMVALVDGAISDAEGACIEQIAKDLNMAPAALQACLLDVRKHFFQQFQGVTLFRDEATKIGRSLGLSDAEIDELLAS